MIPVFRRLCIFPDCGVYYVIPLFLRLKRPLEQAQPSMAKKLKVGATPKDSGEWLVLPPVVLALCDSCVGFSNG